MTKADSLYKLHISSSLCHSLGLVVSVVVRNIGEKVLCILIQINLVFPFPTPLKDFEIIMILPSWV